jgi:hypothetical protein
MLKVICKTAALAMLLTSIVATTPYAASAPKEAQKEAQEETVMHANDIRSFRAALKRANQASSPSTILLADGTYHVTGSTLRINAPYITIRSASGMRDNVVLKGDGMGVGLGVLIDVSSDHFTLANLTLKEVKWHLIQVRAEADADFFHLENAVLQDAGQQLLKVSSSENMYANNGIVQNSLFEYTAGIGPYYYIGGIDAHRSVDWLVKGNTFKNIASPGKSVAEHAVHFWNGSANTKTINNLIIDSDRGIGYGLTDKPNQHEGGEIRGNIIIHTAQHHKFADVGIALESSPNTIVSNNTIFSTSAYPNAIEYRFPRTSNVVIENNITNKAISGRNGGTATLINNNTGGKSRQVLDNIQYLINK